MKTTILLLLVLAFGFVACHDSKDSLAKTENTVLKVDSVTYRLSTEPIISKEGDTIMTYIALKYPKFSGANEAILNKINAQIEQLVKDEILISEDTITPEQTASIESLSKKIYKSYEDFTKENPDMMTMGWDYIGEGDTLFVSPKVITVYYSVYSFTGGAHGNSNTTYLNFDSNTGDLLKLTDIVSDTTAFKKIAELAFDKSEAAFAKDNDFEYRKADYFWDKPFFLPANIAIDRDGLLLLYNPYEAASYARGPISIKLPWQDIEKLTSQGIMKKE